MNRIPLLTVLAVFLACACGKETGAPVTKTAVPENDGDSAASVFLPGQISVYFDDDLVSLVESGADFKKAGTKAAGFAGALEELGVVSMERLFPVDEEFEARHREFGLHRWYRVRFDGGTPAPAAAERFGMVPGVSIANPVYKVATCDTYFDDPQEKSQWHYHNSSLSWADVNVVPVWKKYTRGSSKVIVAVIDAGIDLAHEDLADAVVPPGDNGSRSFMIDNTGYRIVAGEHGTHVAGTIGAINNNGKGVAGLAGGDAKAGEAGVRLMSCQIFQDGLKGANDEAAMVWAADHGAVISNNSWGYDYRDEKGNYDRKAAETAHNKFIQPNTGAYKESMKDAIDYFNTYAGIDKNGRQTGPMAGGLVLFAAGNEGRMYGAPGCYPGCMSVGAITPYGTRSTFSNYGEWVDICAPGVDVLSTTPKNTYSSMSGTSMACPHVAGVAALVVSYCGGTGFTREMLWEKLVGGGNSADVPASYRIGPLVDALGAMVYGTGEPPQKVADVKIDEVISNNVIVSLTVPSDHDGEPAYGFRLLASENIKDLQECDPRSPGSLHFGDFLSKDAKVGERVTGVLDDLGFNTDYYVAVSAYDYGRNFSEITIIGSVTTGGNHAPTMELNYEGNFQFHVQDNFFIPFTVSDEDGHVVNVEYDKDANDEGALTLVDGTKSGEFRLKVLGAAAKAGVYRSVLHISDNYGLSFDYPVDYEVLPNEAPKILKPVENIILNEVGDMLKINMSEYIVDPDGETLSYKVDVSDNSVVHVSQKGGSDVLTLTAIADSGLVTVTLSTTDAGGEKASLSFKVLIRAADQEFQAYPNPVVETLYVGTGQTSEYSTVYIFNALGAQVYSAEMLCSAFEPAEINMRNAGPGLYTLMVTFGGKTYKTTIIKK
ncbi:MAG: S8 family serine peptidase [Bacteroidales bacterium]|nr:S8 family serine peptidase [Bacteroidales bacterium]